MPDREQEANERLRQAQEGSRQAEENVRQAQEGVRETREKKGSECRVEAETGRVGAEGERVTAGEAAAKAEEARVVAEEGRVEAGEMAVKTAKEAVKTAKDVRLRDKTEFYVIYILLFCAGIFAALYGENRDNKIQSNQHSIVQAQKDILNGQRELIFAQREGCERLNVVRENQGAVLQGQINQSKRLLAQPGSLGAIENLRGEIETTVKRLEGKRDNLKDSVNHGLGVKGHPFAIDCKKAYPLPKPPHGKEK